MIVRNDQISRLRALRDSGALNDAEYEREVADLSNREAQRKGLTPAKLKIAIAAAIFVALAGVTYLAARADGFGDASAEVARNEPRANAFSENQSDEIRDATASKAAISPPDDYRNLMLVLGFNALGARLATMENLWLERGRHVTWEPSGPDWIMRTAWHDQLTDTDHEEAFEFYQCGGAAAAPSTLIFCPTGSVAVARFARDGDTSAAIDPAIGAIVNHDRKAMADASQSSSETPGNQPMAGQSETATALKSGRCKLIAKGTTYIDGSCFYSLDENGSFSIYETSSRRGGYFAILQRDGADGIGFWSGSRASTHAQDELGTLSRKGACWENAQSKICLWG
ncbi:SHOCT domain-containing protein [Novosphingobium gossypii]|uniref:SHOCT domain-containing protein n=1 Tax=Novosphingobium gossypii TaxID=1604774 RepID=UPI003D1B7707